MDIVDLLIRQYHDLNPRVRLTLYGGCSGQYRECSNPHQCPSRWGQHRWHIELRHARIDKRGRSYSYGTRYCATSIVAAWDNHDHVPFSDSEMRSLYRLLELLQAVGCPWCAPVSPRFAKRGYREILLRKIEREMNARA